MNAKELKDIIVGRELKIVMILEKWNVSKKDVDEIIDEISKIEVESVEMFKQIEIHKAYINKFGTGSGRKHKVGGSV